MSVDNGYDDRGPRAQHPNVIPPVVVLNRHTPGLADADSIRYLIDEFPHLPLILVLPPNTWNPEEKQALKAIIQTLFEEATTSLQKTGPPAVADSEPSQDHHTTPGRATPTRPQGGLTGWQIRRLNTYVYEHLSDTIHVRDLADLTGLSLGHFAHAFKQSFGESPLAHVTRRRLACACEQMLASDESLSSIAQDCGFCDQSHFTRHFHRALGMSPQHWRRLYAPGPQ